MKTSSRLFFAFALAMALAQSPTAFAEVGSDSDWVGETDAHRLMRILSAYNKGFTEILANLTWAELLNMASLDYERTCGQLSAFIPRPYTGPWNQARRSQVHRGDLDPVIADILTSPDMVAELRSFHPVVSVPVLALSPYAMLKTLRDRVDHSSPAHWGAVLELAVIMKSLTLLNEYSGWSKRIPWPTGLGVVTAITGSAWVQSQLSSWIQQWGDYWVPIAVGAVGATIPAVAAVAALANYDAARTTNAQFWVRTAHEELRASLDRINRRIFEGSSDETPVAIRMLPLLHDGNDGHMHPNSTSFRAPLESHQYCAKALVRVGANWKPKPEN